MKHRYWWFLEWASRAAFAHLVLDVRYERAREGGIVGKQAVQIALGIDADGRYQVLGVDLANLKNHNSKKDFLLALRDRSLKGVHSVVSDDHVGLRRAIRLPRSR